MSKMEQLQNLVSDVCGIVKTQGDKIAELTKENYALLQEVAELKAALMKHRGPAQAKSPIDLDPSAPN